MRRVLGVCLVLSCLLVSVPASASTGVTLTTSLTQLVTRWFVSVSLGFTEAKGADTPPSPTELGPTMDPNG